MTNQDKPAAAAGGNILGDQAPGEADDGLDVLDQGDGFKKAAPQTNAGLPDGMYVMQVMGTKFEKNKEGVPKFLWELQVVAPASHRGRMHWHRNNLTPEHQGWLKGDLETAGLKIDRAVELRTRRGELDGRRIVVKMKTKGEYTNSSFVRLATAEDMNAPGATAASAGVDVLAGAAGGGGEVPGGAVASGAADDGLPF